MKNKLIKATTVVSNSNYVPLFGFYLGKRFVPFEDESLVNKFLSTMSSSDYERFRKEFISVPELFLILPLLTDNQLNQN